MDIRAARPQDYGDYCRLALELDALHEKGAGRWYRAAGDPPRTRVFFDTQLTHPDRALFVVDSGAELAGYVHLETRVEPEVPVLVPMRWANILEVAVAVRFQRLGLGGLLMDHARAWALEKGCRDLRLSVFAFNETAKAFYLGEGFILRNHIMALALDERG